MKANPRPKPLAQLRRSAQLAGLAVKIGLALAVQRIVDAEWRRQCAQLHGQARHDGIN